MEALNRAIACIESGDRAASLAELSALLPAASDSARVVAALLLRVLGRHRDAFAELARVREPRARTLVLSMRLEWTMRLGRLHEVPSIVDQLLAVSPDPRWPAAWADHLFNWGSHERALDAIDRALSIEPKSASMLLVRAGILLALGRREEVLSTLARATELRGDGIALLEAARIACEAGAFEPGERYLERAMRVAPERIEGHLLAAHLALFRGHADEAEAHAERAARIDENASLVFTIRAGAAMLRGDLEGALAHADRAIGADGANYEAHAWRAEALLAAGRPLDALPAADRAVALARGPLISSRVVQQLCRIRTEQYDGGITALGDFAAAIRDLVPEASLDAVNSDVAYAKRTLEQLLTALRGNRTVTATRCDNGVLYAITGDLGARYASRAALQRIVIDPPGTVLRLLDECVAKYPYSALPLAHRGELHLWLGNYVDARRDLEGAIAERPFTRWPYIGLTALEIVEGHFERALEVCALGIERMRSEGPAVYVHRGEALRRLGRFAEAEPDLVRACELHPNRIAAPINLALNHLARGNVGETRRWFDDVRRRAPNLVIDAADEVGTADPFTELSTSELESILTHALGMMRGNRSSSAISYFAEGERLRFVVLGGGNTSRDDERDLARARQLSARLR